MYNERNPARGLSLLMQHESPRYFKNPGDHYQCMVRHDQHPFGLDLPKATGHIREIRFVGYNATDMSVEAFAANMRHDLGYVDGVRLTKLRVITAPFSDTRTPGRNHVFFEVWINELVIISGETTDFSGAGNSARNNLEDIFNVLSKIYGINIDRVTLRNPVDLRLLYRGEVAA